MNVSRRTAKRFWRWRSNPLRRRHDVIEVWVVLSMWAVIAIGGAVLGLVTARAADEVFTQQRAERYAVRAVLVAGSAPSGLARGGAGDGTFAAQVRWTDPDGSVHTDRTSVDAELAVDSGHLTLWTNGRGEIVAEPPTPTEAAVESGLLATGAVLAFAGLVFGAGSLARWGLDRARMAEWGNEWRLVGPQWGHKTG